LLLVGPSVEEEREEIPSAYLCKVNKDKQYLILLGYDCQEKFLESFSQTRKGARKPSRKLGRNPSTDYTEKNLCNLWMAIGSGHLALHEE
jgi:hypothetical protein